ALCDRIEKTSHACIGGKGEGLDRHGLIPVLLDILLGEAYLPRRGATNRIVAQKVAVAVRIAAEERKDQGLFEFSQYKVGKRRVGAIQFAHDKIDQTAMGRRRRTGAGAGRHSQGGINWTVYQPAQRPDQPLRLDPQDQMLEIGRVSEPQVGAGSNSDPAIARGVSSCAVKNVFPVPAQRKSLKVGIAVGQVRLQRGAIARVDEPDISQLPMVEVTSEGLGRASSEIHRAYREKTGHALTEFVSVVGANGRKTA